MEEPEYMLAILQEQYKLYLEAIFDSRAARRVFEDDNIWSIFANASKVERLGGTSKPNEL